MSITALRTKAEYDECIAKNPKVIIDFTASWCGPCRRIGPIFVKFAESFPEIKFVKVDVDENSETSEECDISAMPTFHAYHNGKKVNEVIGASDEKLKTMVEDLNKM